MEGGHVYPVQVSVKKATQTALPMWDEERTSSLLCMHVKVLVHPYSTFLEILVPEVESGFAF